VARKKKKMVTLMQKKIASVVLRIAVSAACVAGISFVMRDKLQDALVTLRHGVAWQWFIAAGFVFLAAQVILTLRLLVLLQAHKIHLTLAKGLTLNFCGLFFNLFLPSAVGGDIAKGVMIAKCTGKSMGATTSIIQDRLVGFIAMLALAGVALFISGGLDDGTILKALPVGLGVAAALLFFLFHKPFARNFKWCLHLVPSKKIKTLLNELYHAIHEYKNHKMILFKAVLLSWGGQLCLVVLYYLTAGSLATWNDPGFYLLAVPASCFISMLPSIGGVGVREAGILFFLSKIMPGEKALAISFLVGLLIYGFSLAGGIIYILQGSLKQDKLRA